MFLPCAEILERGGFAFLYDQKKAGCQKLYAVLNLVT